jgi:hypothetical protein
VCRVPDWTTGAQCPSIGGRLTSGIVSEVSMAMGGEVELNQRRSTLPFPNGLFVSAEPFPCETKR